MPEKNNNCNNTGLILFILCFLFPMGVLKVLNICVIGLWIVIIMLIPISIIYWIIKELIEDSGVMDTVVFIVIIILCACCHFL